MKSYELRIPFGESSVNFSNQESNRMLVHSARMKESNKHLHEHVDYVFRDSQLSSSNKSKRSLGGRASAPSLSKSKSSMQLDSYDGSQRPGTYSRK